MPIRMPGNARLYSKRLVSGKFSSDHTIAENAADILGGIAMTITVTMMPVAIALEGYETEVTR